MEARPSINFLGFGMSDSESFEATWRVPKIGAECVRIASSYERMEFLSAMAPGKRTSLNMTPRRVETDPVPSTVVTASRPISSCHPENGFLWAQLLKSSALYSR